MIATPETDAAVLASGGDWSPVLRETCRRLERERDEARAAYDTLATEHVLAVNKLAEERDDARKEFLITNDKMVEAECSVRGIASLMEKVQRERDEARAIAHDLAVIASHCLGWHDHESGEAAERIADTLKRWKSAQHFKN